MKYLFCIWWGGDILILFCENLVIWNIGGVFFFYWGGFM